MSNSIIRNQANTSNVIRGPQQTKLTLRERQRRARIYEEYTSSSDDSSSSDSYFNRRPPNPNSTRNSSS